MTIGKLNRILRKNNIPADATLMSDSGWEICATDTDGVYYRVEDNTVVLTQDYDNSFYNDSPNWIKLKEIESR
jgi:hypothetical protein